MHDTFIPVEKYVHLVNLKRCKQKLFPYTLAELDPHLRVLTIGSVATSVVMEIDSGAPDS